MIAAFCVPNERLKTPHFCFLYFIDNARSQNHRTFEELCRAHIKAFARGAEKYAAETKLTARVRRWQEKLVPLLEMEEQRPPFDIHAYGNEMIQAMEWHIEQGRRIDNDGGMSKANDDSVVDFRCMVEGCESFEVCRRFLATLSLSNSGNLRFLDPQRDNNSGIVGGSTCASLKLELLSTDIDQPMENYVAPSLQFEAGT